MFQVSHYRCCILGAGCRVQGSGFKLQVLVIDCKFRVSCVGFGLVWSSTDEYASPGWGLRVWGLGFGVWG